ncbi:MAG: response regulator transcription factor [Blastocatellia bacterium]|nr:response regulator transcription factor [Blastocatellia bacterium]
MKAEIRILIADDHPIVRQGLKQIIEEDSKLKVLAEAGDGKEALDKVRSLLPDVAVLDVDMPHMDGFQVARAILSERLPVAIIFLTIHSEEELFQAAMDLGVKGYVLKDSALDDIVAGIKEVVAGRHFTSLPMTSYLMNRSASGFTVEQEKLGLHELTPTEYRILKLLAEYRTSKEIAEELSISPRTVETHRANICQKLDLRGSHALIRFAAKYKSLL